MPGNPLTDPHWAHDLADTVERVVADVRDRTTDKVVLAARALVYGILATLIGGTAFVLLIIVMIRITQVLLDTVVTPAQAVYLSYFIVGGICCLVGALFMKKRHAPDA